MLLKFALARRVLIFRSKKILRFLVPAALRMPKLALAVALLVLAALASTLTYTGFLVVGVLAEQLGTGRFVAGLLLGVLFARLPKLSEGKLRTVGLLPKIARQPVMLGLLTVCLVIFLSRGEYVPALFAGLTAAFLLAFPLIKRAIFGRVLSSLFSFPAGRNASKNVDDNVIDVEFREKKE